MPFENHANLAYATVATAPSPATSGTSLTVASGKGALFPASNFSITVYPSGVDPLASNAEICLVTSRTGDVFTITRAQEGTSAKSIGVGWQVANTATAKTFTDIESAIAAGGGTVTSIGLSAPAILNVANSPVTTAGTIALTLADQSANQIFAGPSSGGAAAPAFRSGVEADLTLSDNTTNNVSSARHGFAPKSPADATQFLNGANPPAYALVKDSDLSTSDITTNDVTAAKHGFAPKLSGNATEYLDGTGNYSVPAGGGGGSDWTTTVVKSVDQTVTNNTTPQNDTELSVSLDANSLYMVQVILLYYGNSTTTDYRWRLTFPDASPIGNPTGFICTYSSPSLAAPAITPFTGSSTQFPSTDNILGAVDNTVPLTCFIQMLMRTSSAGTLQYQFANSVGGVAQTSTTLAGSCLRVRKFA